MVEGEDHELWAQTGARGWMGDATEIADQLLDLIYESDTPAFDRSVDVRIGRVRKKLGEDPRDPKLIKTVRNDGYIFVGKVTAPQ